MLITDWEPLFTHIVRLETEGLVTRTFRRLDPERQQAILSAILEDAAERGPTEVTMKSIAKKAGVSVGSLYQYFTSREKLIDFTIAVTVPTMREMLESFLPMLQELPLKDALEAYLLGGVEWSLSQPGFVQFYARAAYSGDPHFAETVVEPIGAVLRQTVVAILEKAASRGELRAGVDVEAAGRAANALFIAIIDPQLLPYLNYYFQVVTPDLPGERLALAAVDLILHGIATEAK
jgi:TetR/AcrR family transcriptional regulator